MLFGRCVQDKVYKDALENWHVIRYYTLINEVNLQRDEED